MRSKSFRVVILQLCAFLPICTAASSSQCYWPDGTDAQANYVPCNATLSSSACCAANDACTTDGWCLGASGYVYRGGCTDPNWSASSPCQQACKSTGSGAGAFQNLVPCTAGYPATQFCCSDGASTTSCCNESFLPGGEALGGFPYTGSAFMPDFESEDDLAGITTSGSAASKTATSAVSTTTQVVLVTITQASSPSKSSSGVSGGGVAGVAIGSVLLGAAIGVIAGYMFWRHKSNGAASPPYTQSMVPLEPANVGTQPQWQPYQPPATKPAAQYEIGTGYRSNELEG